MGQGKFAKALRERVERLDAAAKPDRFADLLRAFEMAVREEQSETLPDYRSALKQDVGKLRVRVLEMFHKAKLDRSGR